MSFNDTELPQSLIQIKIDFNSKKEMRKRQPLNFW